MSNFMEKIKIKNNAKFVFEIHKTREKFTDIIKQFLLSNGIESEDIKTDWANDFTIFTDENWSNVEILKRLSDMNLDSLKFDFSSDKLVTINIS